NIISFKNKYSKIILYLVFFTFRLSLLYILINFISVLINGIEEPGYFTIIFGILFLGSIQLISLGVVGQYIGRIYYEVKDRPHYVVQHSNIDKEENNYE